MLRRHSSPSSSIILRKTTRTRSSLSSSNCSSLLVFNHRFFNINQNQSGNPLASPPHEQYYQNYQYQQQGQQGQQQNPQGDYHQSAGASTPNNTNNNSNFWSTMPIFFLIGFTISYLFDKLEDIFISPCNTMAKYLREDGVALISCARDNRYHDPMFRESIVLMTFIGPQGCEGLIINKPIQNSDFSRVNNNNNEKKKTTIGSDKKEGKENHQDKKEETIILSDEMKEKQEEQKKELKTLLDAVNRDKRWEIESAQVDANESTEGGADLQQLLEALSPDRSDENENDNSSENQSSKKSNKSKSLKDFVEESTLKNLSSSSDDAREEKKQSDGDKNNNSSKVSSSSSSAAASHQEDQSHQVLRCSSLPRPLPGILQNELANNPVFCGGPMLIEQNIVNLLHPLKGVVGSLQVAPGLYLGGEQQQLQQAIKKGKLKSDDVLVILGSSSWGSRQLFSEWKRSGWEFFVGSKDETNMTNVCRRINNTVTRADNGGSSSENQTQLIKKKSNRVLNNEDLWKAMKRMYADDIAKREVDYVKLMKWKRSSNKTSSEEDNNNPSNNNSTDDDVKKETSSLESPSPTTTEEEMKKIITPFVPSSFFGEREHKISKEIWDDHYECLDSMAKNGGQVRTAVLGKCLGTNLKQAGTFGRVSNPSSVKK